ncbi:MAG: hypothetical protein HFE98_01630 [Ruminiclostridium sp.]|nr:hypothetical protein [Ruminiclostridium sp.]
MNEMKVSAVPMTGVVQHSTKAQNPQPGAGEDVSQEQTVGAVAKRGEDEINNLKEMLQQAKEKAEERRDSLKLKQNSAQYGDAAMMAYARLARARNQGQVNAAASYAQRQIVRFQSALRSDSENAERIKAAIRQLQKAVGRAGKKKRELQKEDIIKARQRKAKLEKQKRKSASLQQELTRRKSMRLIRESGYLRETEIDNRLQAQMAATRMELRAQSQALAEQFGPSMEQVSQEYAAQAGMVEVAPAGGVDIQA